PQWHARAVARPRSPLSAVVHARVDELHHGGGDPRFIRAHRFLHHLEHAVAGVASNIRLLRLLRTLSGSARVARKVLFAWLAGNLFLGSQLCWILRPFIGSPGLPTQFLRADAFKGNFYETVF